VRPLISDFIHVSLLTARRLDSCLGRRTSRVSTRRLCEVGAHGSLETHILVRGARLTNPQACAARVPSLLLLSYLPFHGYSCMRKANPTRVGWGGGECSCTCGLLARSVVARDAEGEPRDRVNGAVLGAECRHVLLRVNRPSDPFECGVLHAARTL
jgi:hypothetical protein